MGCLFCCFAAAEAIGEDVRRRIASSSFLHVKLFGSQWWHETRDPLKPPPAFSLARSLSYVAISKTPKRPNAQTHLKPPPPPPPLASLQYGSSSHPNSPHNSGSCAGPLVSRLRPPFLTLYLARF
ncbi:hypothetical protein ACMFMG_003585 [Clarireedia jacksonii]